MSKQKKRYEREFGMSKQCRDSEGGQLTVAATLSSNLLSGNLFINLYSSPLPANSSIKNTLPSS